MQLGYLIIFVEDVLSTVKFYEKAFGLELKFLHDSQMYAELLTGESTLAFAQEDFAKSNSDFELNRLDRPAAGFEIGLVSDKVEKAYQKALDAGATQVVAPHQKPWGQTVGYLKDLNGVLVEICSPMESS